MACSLRRNGPNCTSQTQCVPVSSKHNKRIIANAEAVRPNQMSGQKARRFSGVSATRSVEPSSDIRRRPQTNAPGVPRAATGPASSWNNRRSGSTPRRWRALHTEPFPGGATLRRTLAATSATARKPIGRPTPQGSERCCCGRTAPSQQRAPKPIACSSGADAFSPRPVSAKNAVYQLRLENTTQGFDSENIMFGSPQTLKTRRFIGQPPSTGMKSTYQVGQIGRPAGSPHA